MLKKPKFPSTVAFGIAELPWSRFPRFFPFLFCFLSSKVICTLNMGLELTTPKSRATCSTKRASQVSAPPTTRFPWAHMLIHGFLDFTLPWRPQITALAWSFSFMLLFKSLFKMSREISHLPPSRLERNNELRWPLQSSQASLFSQKAITKRLKHECSLEIMWLLGKRKC